MPSFVRRHISRDGRATRRRRGVSGAQEALLFAPGGDYYPSTRGNPIPGLSSSTQLQGQGQGQSLQSSNLSINVADISREDHRGNDGENNKEPGQRHSSPARVPPGTQEEDDFVALGRLRREKRKTVSRMGYIKQRLNHPKKRHHLSISIEECGAEEISPVMVDDIENNHEDQETQLDLEKECEVLEDTLEKEDATLKTIEAKIGSLTTVKAERKRVRDSTSKDQFIEDIFADIRSGDLDSLKVRVAALQLETKSDFSLTDVFESSSQLPPLHVALMSEQQHIVRYLIEHGGLEVTTQTVTSTEDDVDILLPFHLALLHGNLEAMRLIVESVADRKDRADMINQVVIHELTSGEGKDELPLFSAVASCRDDLVKVRDTIEYLIENGADLALQTANGNTLLHLMVLQTVHTRTPSCVPYLKKIVVEIFGELAAKWWQTKVGSEDKYLMSLSFQECRIQALKHLLGIRNNDHQSPITLAALLEAPLYLDFFRWERVIRFPDPRLGGYFQRTHTYDVTEINSVDSKGSYKATSVMHIVAHNSVRLSDTREKEDILMTEPLKTLVKLKWSVYRWVFYTLAVLHLAHMCAFTGVMFQHTDANNLTYHMKGKALEARQKLMPILCNALFLLLPLVYLISGIIDHVSVGNTKVKCPAHGNLLYRVVAAGFSMLTFLWYVLHVLHSPAETYVICFTLLLGWIFLLFFTRGIILPWWNIQVGMFSSMLHRMFFFDVVPFALMAFLVLISFSTAFHVLILQSSFSTAEHREYGVTLYLMVKYLVGLPNPQDHAPTEGEMLPKLLLVVYGLITVVLLINMLIASMNKSYEMIRSTKVNPVYRQRLSILLMLERRLPLCIRRRTQRSFEVLTNPRTEKEEMFLKITDQY